MMSESTRAIEYFNNINMFPRCSHNEAKLAQWLWDWAEQRHFSVRKDAVGNLVIRIPASGGYEEAATVILQGHMDMVCEKTPQSDHDFTVDPIIPKVQGDWLTAEGTTLGADNGIAIAYALALAENPHLAHPPLELLFTVDEESGLNGAKGLDASLLSGKILINLDSEDEGIFTIGCAGGQDYELTLNHSLLPLPSHWVSFHLIIGGLRGGHSGIDIHQPRGNANKLLAHFLAALRNVFRLSLIDIKGGSRHNAIPRDAEAWFVVDSQTVGAAEDILTSVANAVSKDFAANEPDLKISWESADPVSHQAISPADSTRMVDLLLALPHGVAGLSQAFGSMVETSCNLATVRCKDGQLTVLSSQRSSVMSHLDEINQRVLAVARLVGAAARGTTGYPPWTPNPGSLLLARSQKVYRTLFGKDPIVQSIHAGLECAIIGDRVAGMDMISFGPTIENPHSPFERLYLPSVEKVWRFLVALLKDMR
jgi:dipeptidase D